MLTERSILCHPGYTTDQQDLLRAPLWNIFKVLLQVRMEKLLAKLQDPNLSGQREGGRYRSKRGRTHTERRILHSSYLERDYGLQDKTKHF